MKDSYHFDLKTFDPLLCASQGFDCPMGTHKDSPEELRELLEHMLHDHVLPKPLKKSDLRKHGGSL